MLTQFDKGFVYLVTDDVELFDDGSGWGDAGTGSYNWNDGSWGEKNADGTASFNGIDGCWGSVEIDGSGSYTGKGGVWGTIDCDGHGTFYGRMVHGGL